MSRAESLLVTHALLANGSPSLVSSIGIISHKLSYASCTANHDLMVRSFESAMEKMTVLGNDVNKLIDCSEVIPVPGTTVDAPHLPAGKTRADIQASCPEIPFPILSANPGPETTISPV